MTDLRRSCTVCRAPTAGNLCDEHKPRCADCGTRLTRPDQKRCRPCANLHSAERSGGKAALVDARTPYAEDVACQRLVAAHPGGMELAEIGAAMGLTHQRVQQIEAQALANLERRLRLIGITAEAFAEHLASHGERDVWPEPVAV